jgi:hypothetical protein
MQLTGGLGDCFSGQLSKIYKKMLRCEDKYSRGEDRRVIDLGEQDLDLRYE